MSFFQGRRWTAAVGGALLTLSLTGTAIAATTSEQAHAPLPGFHDGYVRANGIRIHYVTGGHGPALLLLHGWPVTWYGWAKIAPRLAQHYTLVMPDLTGLGDTQVPADDRGRYAAPSVAADMHAVVVKLGIRDEYVAGHDWGGAVAIAYAAEYRTQVRKLVVMEAGADLEAVARQFPDVFWFNGFQRLKALPEQLVVGRERPYYTFFYRGGAPSSAFSQATIDRYVRAYSGYQRVHASFGYYRQEALTTSEISQIIQRSGKVTMPVLGVGGARSLGAGVAKQLTGQATDVTSAIVPNTGHWLIEENPCYIYRLLTGFLH